MLPVLVEMLPSLAMVEMLPFLAIVEMLPPKAVEVKAKVKTDAKRMD